MSEILKIKVDFDNAKAQALLQFISETQDGKYTIQKPDLTQVTYKRLEIQEQDKTHSIDDNSEDVVLFGVRY
ncbi:MAG: hypothetical protein ABI772_14420 [Bacteroidota bacterium]